MDHDYVNGSCCDEATENYHPTLQFYEAFQRLGVCSLGSPAPLSSAHHAAVLNRNTPKKRIHL